MHFPIKILFCGLLMFGAVGSVRGQNTCLANWFPKDSVGVSNPYEMLVDTCDPANGLIDMLWAKGGVIVAFWHKVFHLPYAPADSFLTISWNQIDVNYPQLRAEFNTIYTRFGAFVLQKMHPNDTLDDLEGNLYNIVFTEYTHI